MNTQRTPSPAAPGPPRRRRRRREPSDRVGLAVEVLAVMATMPSAVAGRRLAFALRWPPSRLGPVLAALGRSALVEARDDRDGRGEARVALSALSLARLGRRPGPR